MMQYTLDGLDIMVVDTKRNSRMTITRNQIKAATKKMMLTGTKILHPFGGPAVFYSWTGPKQLAAVIARGTYMDNNAVEVVSFGSLVASNIEMIAEYVIDGLVKKQKLRQEVDRSEGGDLPQIA
jgi:hypothetical protein